MHKSSGSLLCLAPVEREDLVKSVGSVRFFSPKAGCGARMRVDVGLHSG